MTTTQTLPTSPAPIARRAVLSWALYDLANTIFSMNIVSLYFSLWVVNEMGGIDADYGNANSISMALMFFTAAILGAPRCWALGALRSPWSSSSSPTTCSRAA